MKSTYIYKIWTTTPTQVGGNAEINSPIDNAIAREVYTKHPYIPASSIKGSLKRNYRDQAGADSFFGEADKIGSASISDAKILAFPVSSLYGVFGWISCPIALNNFYQNLGIKGELELIQEINEDEIIISTSSNLAKGKQVVLDQLVLQAKKKNFQSVLNPNITPPNSANEFFHTKFSKDFAIVNDDVFTLITKNNSDIQMRTNIDENTGVAKDGALWSEEYLPENTLLYGLMRLSDQKNQNLSNLIKNFDGILQIGANESIGKGFTLIELKNLG